MTTQSNSITEHLLFLFNISLFFCNKTKLKFVVIIIFKCLVGEGFLKLGPLSGSG